MSAISGSPAPKHPSYLEGIQRQEGKQHPIDHPNTGRVAADVPFPSTWCPRRAIAKAQPSGCSGVTQAWELRQVQGSGEGPVARPRQTETGVGSWLCLPPSSGFPFRVSYRGWFLLLVTNNPDQHWPVHICHYACVFWEPQPWLTLAMAVNASCSDQY